ncbi:LysE/ArgO family amino acid transporter [Atopomonas sediminilitoris]|uniref:LysE/ArgO family amino acid transporter n=1 Tax=Atopomonas sediminilitoris TaxID=2919919 RepID=UPI001F4E22F5|nr:LysE family transporter [Atopomonas sediminilitoris]MCJ8168707.1 LysE family transporter [Atopomonas sediminilitoris]
MWQSYWNGLGIAAGLIIAIGTQNAFVLGQSLKREYHLSAALLCILCDALMIVLGVFGLAALLASHPAILQAVRWGGVVFLLAYAGFAAQRALRPQALLQQGQQALSHGAVVLTTLAVTLLNPHFYLDTLFLIGSLGSQQAHPAAYAAGAASASALWFIGLALGAAWLAPWLARPLTWRLLDSGIALLMLVIAYNLAFGQGLDVPS